MLLLDLSFQKAMDYKHIALKRKYGPASERSYRRQCKQDRRWMQALMERRDPERPMLLHDRETFVKLTRVMPHRFSHDVAENASPPLKASEASAVVGSLLIRLACERKQAAKKRPPRNIDGIVDDWWGEAPFMWVQATSRRLL